MQLSQHIMNNQEEKQLTARNAALENELVEKKRQLEIEAALERVRARTMAMQRSEELGETAAVLFQQLRNLDLKFWSAGVFIWKSDTILENWMGNNTDGMALPPMQLHFKEDKKHRNIYEAGKRGELFYEEELKGKALAKHYAWLISQPSAKEVIERLKNYGITPPSVQWNYAAIFKQGYLLIIAEEPEAGMKEVSMQFATVFEQTYTRFLDLQKAEAQAREATIEASLERVRSKTMAMHNSNDVGETVATMFNEFEALGIHTNRCGILIFKDADFAEVWTAKSSTERKATLITGKLQLKEHLLLSSAFDGWDKKQSFHQYMLTGDDLVQYYDVINRSEYYPTQFDLQSLPQKEYHSDFYFPDGAVFSFTQEPVAEEALKIIKRFAGVFGQTYRRFLDLQKAEAQARESQIQLALERVRARTMAMQRSDELQDAASLMVQQIQTLGVPQFASGFNIWDDDRKAATAWMCNVNTDNLPPPFKTSSSEDIFLLIHDAAQRGELLFVGEQAGEELKTHYTYMKSIPIFREYVERASPEGLSIPDFQIMHCAFFSQGYLMFITYEPVPEAHDIFKRFAKVFEQTYTRFLDLQKAEAQAREAHIEAALERIRSRTMAMQKSDELTEVAGLLFAQVSALGIKTWTAGFNVWSEDNNSYTDYITSPNGGFIEPYTVYTETAEALRDISNARKSGVEFDVQYVEGEKIKQLYLALQKLDERQYEIMLQDGVRFPSHQYEHFVFGSKVSLMFITYEPVQEAHDLFKRLGKVFEQTYTRFLDLQKAEAQAREAEIELALERVRARTMAMQNSDELAEAAVVLFQQVRILGIQTYSSGFTIWENNDNELVSWMCNADGSINPPFRMPAAEIAWHRQQYESWKKKENYIIHDFTGKEMQDHFAYLRAFPLLNEAFKTSEAAGVPTPVRQVHNAFNFSQGNLLFITLQPNTGTYDIFQRFAKVFEQTYTRFLDLQKAEAQARESQIQLALERVRARTMAMQRSDELQDAASLMVQQIQTLGVPQFASGFNIWDDDRKAATAWMCNVNTDNLSLPFKTSSSADIFLLIHDAAQRGELLFVREQVGEELKTHYEYMNSIPVFREYVERASPKGLSIPDFQIMHCAFFSQGYLMFITYEPVPAAHEIFKRFAKVFEQTYTHFLDLQKAEAQAREAQIEAALERVRSRSMGMQKSEELKEVIKIVYQQLTHLKIKLDHAGFVVDYTPGGDWHFWIADEQDIPSKISHPYFESVWANQFNEAKDKAADFFTTNLNFEEKNKFYNELLSYVPGLPEASKDFYLSCPGLAASTVLFDNVSLYIENFSCIPYTNEENKILLRFGKVFQQTYTRFLDLKKTEAQAREAEIELGLERVRARAMAMQKSDELAAAAQVLYTEFAKLGINTFTCGYMFIDEEENSQTAWVVLPDGTLLPNSVEFPLTGDLVLDSRYIDWKAKKAFHVYELQGEENKEHHRFLLKHVRGVVAEEIFDHMPDRIVFHCANFSNGYLLILAEEIFTKEEQQTVIRFANVFEMTYTRFLDLQKAEAQAREATIEGALERVRARTMGMQRSDELKEAALLLFQQVDALGMPPFACGFNIWDDDRKATTAWMGSISGVLPPFKTDSSKDVFLPIYEAAQKGESLFVIEQSGRELEIHYQYMASIPIFRDIILEDWKRAGIPIPTFQIIHCAYFTQGYLMFISFEPVPAYYDIFKRFAKVFEQTYTRFLDLQKAEAQTREAGIQLALERVRARTMAMQQSGELNEVSTILFNQLRSLGGSLWTTAIVLCNENSNEDEFRTAFAGGLQPSVFVPNNQDAVHIKMYEGWKNGSELLSISKEGNELKAHYDYMMTVPSIKDNFEKMLVSGITFPAWQKWHAAYFTFGYLMIITTEPYHDEQIFGRFAKVFDQSYTRFLDLQKAEAQVREAEIELALERVRAKTMAMRKPGDLSGIGETLYNQLKTLDFNQFRNAEIIINNDEKETILSYYCDYGVCGTIEVNYKANPILKKWAEQLKESNDAFVEVCIPENEMTKWRKFREEIGYKPDLKLKKAKTVYYYSYSTGLGALSISSFNAISKEQIKILERFRNVFNLSYQRYIDIANAETQAKEAKIEAALERVRSRSLAMHNTSELQDVVNIVAKQLHQINIDINGGVFITINDEVGEQLPLWASQGAADYVQKVVVPPLQEPFFKKLTDAIRHRKDFYLEQLSHDEKLRLFQHLFNYSPWNELPLEKKNDLLSREGGLCRSVAISKHTSISITDHYGKKFSDEDNEILKRFAKVLEQAYTRFLDLQKAEAQAREARVETSLERVRSRTMAMQHSSELQDAAALLFDEVKALGVPAFSCGYNIFEQEDVACTSWMSNPNGSGLAPMENVPLTQDANFIRFRQSKQDDEEFYVLEMRKERMQEHYRYLRTISTEIEEAFTMMEQAGIPLPGTQIHHLGNFANGNVMFITLEPCPEAHDIFKRFTKVFEQTYTRFLDLQKAEAQAREAQIETGLEKVRSRTMAMQRSDELSGTAALLFQEFKKLEQQELIQTTIGIYNEVKNEIEFRATDWEGRGGQVSQPAYGSMHEPSLLQPAVAAWKANAKSVVIELTGEALEGWIHYRNKMTDTNISSLVDGERRVISFAFFSKGHLSMSSPLPLPAETVKTLERFATVFDSTYTRFLDLQKAEAQAREAQIEAALERVRSRSMSMQKSEDLHSVVNTLYGEFKSLNVNFHVAAIRLLQDESLDLHLWLSTSDGMYDNIIHWPYTDLPIFHLFQKARKTGQFMEHTMSEFETSQFFEAYFKLDAVPKERKGATENVKLIDIAAAFQKFTCIFLMRYTEGSYSHYEKDIISRFSNVFEQTYTRFLDLKKAEAQALLVIKQASVDRVRAEIASMRTTMDLEKITPLVWNELTTLGVPFIRCGVFIMDEEHQQVQSFLSTPDGKAIAAFRQPYNAAGETAQIIASWQKKEMYKQHWGEAQFNEFTKNLVQQGAITSGEKYLTENRPTDLYLHFLPFLQGMLYAGNTAPLNDDELQLMQNLADAFATAYARYEDFNKLESANIKIERTLVDLKQAQAQLVQSEKMASLGELTAGIAHEIQNPLNFVNNFSEVSKELLDEMSDAFEKGNTAEAKDIMNDVIENLEKINHHGKRADAIVKGMLQHSRRSTAGKQPTDINKLADEYLRLSYHGLRAKDKLFNATLNTDFDESIGLINIIPQDIGRVILNLLNNAFYAVNEKKQSPHLLKGGNEPYEPTVTVTTRRLGSPLGDGGTVEIKVTDNGNGIPQKVLDKIFQPFFTTKPTGQGTGLGLSLSYDIVKAHGGELKVESIEGRGTEFIIMFPAEE
jgi:signal transduction histidine kinase